MQVTRDIDKLLAVMDDAIKRETDLQAPIWDAWQQICLLASIGLYATNVVNGIRVDDEGISCDGPIRLIQELIKDYGVTV